MLHEIGFWYQHGEGSPSLDRSDPTRLVDAAWAAAADPACMRRLQWYLTRGAFVESHELAYSYCRFPDCAAARADSKVMGACTMTDGVYCWPEAYWHYVDCHSVRPPEEFLQHVDANYDRLLARVTETEQCLLLWDDMEQQAAPMPRAMQEWITAYTTVQVAKPDIKETS